MQLPVHFPSPDSLMSILSPTLPPPLNYVPFAFRLFAVLLAAPFLALIALDMIAYLITRTLHISTSQTRVPRSPPHAPLDLADESEDEDEDADEKSTVRAGSDSQHKSFTRRFATLWYLSLGVVFAVSGILLQMSEKASITTAARLAQDVSPNAPTALVLTAHPDDEAMFFAPTILTLLAAGWRVLGVCLSDGNADGLGETRGTELLNSYALLGIPNSDVTLVRDPQLQDSMQITWDAQYIADLISPVISDNGVTHLVTFDDLGVTQHPNHMSLADVHEHLDSQLRLLTLKSPTVAAKFTGPLWAAVLHARDLMGGVGVSGGEATAVEEVETVKEESKDGVTADSETSDVAEVSEDIETKPVTETESEVPVNKAAAASDDSSEPHHLTLASPSQFLTALRAMRAHDSQLVWFRWLYVAFSHLMWVNELEYK